MKTEIAFTRIGGFTAWLVKILTVACVIAGAGYGSACGLCSSASNLDALAKLTISENSSLASQAIACLRAKGPIGLEALFRVHADAINKHKASLSVPLLRKTTTNATWQRLSQALDAVGQQ